LEESAASIFSPYFVLKNYNYGLDAMGEKERRTSKKKWMEEVQAAMTTRNLEPDQWRNREEWRLVSGRRRQLLKNRTDR